MVVCPDRRVVVCPDRSVVWWFAQIRGGGLTGVSCGGLPKQNVVGNLMFCASSIFSTDLIF